MQAHESPMQSGSTFFLIVALNGQAVWNKCWAWIGEAWNLSTSASHLERVPSRRGTWPFITGSHCNPMILHLVWRHPKTTSWKCAWSCDMRSLANYELKPEAFFATKLLSFEINTVSLSRSTFTQKNPGIPFHSHTCPGACSTCMGRK